MKTHMWECVMRRLWVCYVHKDIWCYVCLYWLWFTDNAQCMDFCEINIQSFTWTRKFDHITPVLQNLHWLPIRSHSKFKLLLLVYKCLYDLAQSYLSKRLSDGKQKSVVSQLWCLIFEINFLVILDSQSQLMFLKGLWRHIFSKKHLAFIQVISFSIDERPCWEHEDHSFLRYLLWSYHVPNK